MNNISIITDNGKCIGCMACISVCPQGALEVKKCKMGFPVPIKNKNCNDCGDCLCVCPNYETEDNEND